jgi:hypothetical protein
LLLLQLTEQLARAELLLQESKAAKRLSNLLVRNISIHLFEMT